MSYKRKVWWPLEEERAMSFVNVIMIKKGQRTLHDLPLDCLCLILSFFTDLAHFTALPQVSRLFKKACSLPHAFAPTRTLFHPELVSHLPKGVSFKTVHCNRAFREGTKRTVSPLKNKSVQDMTIVGGEWWSHDLVGASDTIKSLTLVASDFALKGKAYAPVEDGKMRRKALPVANNYHEMEKLCVVWYDWSNMLFIPDHLGISLRHIQLTKGHVKLCLLLFGCFALEYLEMDDVLLANDRHDGVAVMGAGGKSQNLRIVSRETHLADEEKWFVFLNERLDVRIKFLRMQYASEVTTHLSSWKDEKQLLRHFFKKPQVAPE